MKEGKPLVYSPLATLRAAAWNVHKPMTVFDHSPTKRPVTED